MDGRKCKSCGSRLDGGVCTQCGLVWEESTMVNDLTFGESSSGAAVVNGSFVSAEQSGPGRGGLYGNSNGREVTIEKARNRIYGVAHYLRIPEPAIQAAIANFKLALSMNFIRGRKSKYVTCACLYLGCRIQHTSHMIMEFATFLKVNVYILGNTYSQLLRLLRPMLGSEQLRRVVTIDPTIYIVKFINRLNFASEDSKKVNEDAFRLIKRMDKDWMAMGRRPGGIAAASILIACRMNNLKRSKAHIMQIAMISESTIDKRLKEFKATVAGTLSVKDFRATNVESSADPPSFLKNRDMERTKNSLQLLANESEKGDDDNDGVSSNAEDDFEKYTEEDILEMAEEARQLYQDKDEEEDENGNLPPLEKSFEDRSLGRATLYAIEAAKAEVKRIEERRQKRLEAKLRQGIVHDGDEENGEEKEEDEDSEGDEGQEKKKSEEDQEVEEEESDDDEDIFVNNKETVKKSKVKEDEEGENEEKEDDEENKEDSDEEDEGKEDSEVEVLEKTKSVKDEKAEEEEAEKTKDSSDEEKEEDSEDEVEIFNEEGSAKDGTTKDEAEEEEKDNSENEEKSEETKITQVETPKSDEEKSDEEKSDDENPNKETDKKDLEHESQPGSTDEPSTKRRKLTRQERIDAILRRHNHPLVRMASRDTADAAPESQSKTWVSKISDDPENLSDVDDDELDRVICSETEVARRQRLWVSLNHDYELDQARRRNKIESDKRAGVYKEPRKRRAAQSRFGWGNRALGSQQYKQEEDGDGSSGSMNARSVAVNMMMERSKMLKVSKKSKKINYGALDGLLNLGN